MSSSARSLLRHALPLISSHGFSREALSLAALSLPKPHERPLSEQAVTALFGEGDDARRTLIGAWLEEGKEEMGKGGEESVGAALRTRLRWNRHVLPYLPEAFALLASPSTGIPPLNPLPALEHSGSIADRACRIAQDRSIGTEWYTRRASLAALYTAAELHQLTSPETAEDFLDDMLKSSDRLGSAFQGTAQYLEFIGRSWVGIIKSSGVL